MIPGDGNLKCFVNGFHRDRCRSSGILPGTESGKIFLRRFPAAQQADRLGLDVFSVLDVLRNCRRKFFEKDLIYKQLISG